MRILFVCMGNICRSPTAEAAVGEALAEVGLDDQVELDSAGTGDWHIGDSPDPRMVDAAAVEGLHVHGFARQFQPEDFDRFDLVLVMDHANLREVLAQARDDTDRDKVRLFRDYADDRGDGQIPDPYYGGEEGFRQVVTVARQAARGLANELAAR